MLTKFIDDMYVILPQLTHWLWMIGDQMVFVVIHYFI